MRYTHVQCTMYGRQREREVDKVGREKEGETEREKKKKGGRDL